MSIANEDRHHAFLVYFAVEAPPQPTSVGTRGAIVAARLVRPGEWRELHASLLRAETELRDELADALVTRAVRIGRRQFSGVTPEAVRDACTDAVLAYFSAPSSLIPGVQGSRHSYGPAPGGGSSSACGRRSAGAGTRSSWMLFLTLSHPQERILPPQLTVVPSSWRPRATMPTAPSSRLGSTARRQLSWVVWPSRDRRQCSRGAPRTGGRSGCGFAGNGSSGATNLSTDESDDRVETGRWPAYIGVTQGSENGRLHG